uniref:Uncharacterized protein n=1 Tax=Arundo donax TaxID=35708 RepID=A0A0A9BEQ9_ARUDO
MCVLGWGEGGGTRSTFHALHVLEF